MKKFKRMVIIGVSIMMVLWAVAGCSKTDNSKRGLEQGLAEKLDNPNISILFNGVLGDITEQSIKEFEQKYGGKVTLTQTTINEKPIRLISMITAGDPPDTVTWSSQHMPLWVIKDLVQPIEDYFILEDPIWNIKLMEQMKYKGRHYGVLDGNPNPFVVYFNKTMFENNGLKTPLEYYREGQWNWENFRKVAMALTQDTTRDGTIDQWGYEEHNRLDLFVYSNGGRFINYNDDGTAELTITDPKVMEALQFAQNGIIRDRYSIQSSDFISGKVAMSVTRPGKDLLDTMKYEWDIAPFPMGPRAEKHISGMLATLWGIGNGAKNPEGAAAWLYMKALIGENYEPLEEDKLYNEEQEKLLAEIKKEAVIIKYVGVLNLRNNIFWNPMRAGQPIQGIIDANMPVFRSEIEQLFQN